MNSVAIKEIASNMRTTKENWKGNTNEAFIIRYKELKEYFPKIVEGIDTYATFLDDVSSSYEFRENDINNNIENNDINLEVN